MEPSTAIPDDTRTLILEAASKRFQQFGYNKTTMAEIASDCGMSAANLYRYFKNKQDIGAAFACTCFAQRKELLGEVITRPGLSASQRLEAFVLATLHHTYNATSEQPRINELAAIIASERPDIVHIKTDMERGLITEILVEGNKNGEFDVRDIEKTAEALRATLVQFSVPIFMTLYTLEEFEHMARYVVQLVIHGLSKH